MAGYKIIDCRARPDTAPFIETLKNPLLQNDMRKFGRTPPTKAQPLKECMEFFESEGVSRIVCMGRDMETGTPGCDTVLDNAYIAQIAAEEPERIIGIAGINPLKPDAVQNVRHAIQELGLKGISMDPAFMDLYADDERIYPVYEECARLGVPVILTLGPRPFGHGTRMCYCTPLPVDHVAADFPALRILVSHGGFPWMQEMVAIAFRNDNVWFETSAYWFMPGVSGMIVEAVNGHLADKICFGTAYPFAPVRETIERFAALPFKPEALPKLFEHNIRKLLGEEQQS